MPVGSLKQILPANKNETIFAVIAFLAGVLVSCMFLKKKSALLEGINHKCHHNLEGYGPRKN